jgi:TPP-dependent pyruvate/acetoin dehydrogenase alpha subunit
MDNKFIINLYKKIYYIRKVEQKVAEIYKDNLIKSWIHLGIGQEGVASGVCLNLTKKDFVLSYHRSHSAYLACGGDLVKFFAELMGRKYGCSLGMGGSMHLISEENGFYGSTSIVGGTIGIATGIAFANKLAYNKNITVSFFGDGAVEEGICYESLNFAAVHNLPIIYVCENNGYAISQPLLNRQNSESIYKRFENIGVKCLEVDGNNPIEVFKITKKCVGDIKIGKGPFFIEAKTYRTLGHTGPDIDDHLGYRSPEEVDEWRNKCPLKFMKNFLIGEKISIEHILKHERLIDDKIIRAYEVAVKEDFPVFEEIKDFVYN